ncbi:HD domain-containing phosphohydrolase [Acetivibrio cellulolyticus]|uniref:HD domain-containing phosphohydrolase n=1 Tax=Acetivibrio cellulolyticus TaxID=35830 RepID=UPI0001E2BE2E|nr:HD domain-containing phosphohydrolase [Acetivibrio cellulolyticus]
MRKKITEVSTDYKILIVDDEEGIINSLKVMLTRSGYFCVGISNPIEAIKHLETEPFDMLILDYIMSPIHGDEVVAKIREFNKDIYILLLTGHKDLAPPLETIKALDIQGYCEKGDRFDQLLLLIESGIKSISQMRTIKQFKDGLNRILYAVPKIYQLQPIDTILEEILEGLMPLVNSKDAFILVDDCNSSQGEIIYKGVGEYKIPVESLVTMLSPDLMEHIGFSRANRVTVNLDHGIILPLIGDNKSSIGVIYIESNNFDEGLKLLEIYSTQAASSINNAFLHSLINMKKEELDRTYQELRNRYIDTIEALRLTVDAKDIYTRGHSDRVSYYTGKLGEEFNLSPEEIELLKVGGIFHDIGKIGTADDILFKTDKLDFSEYEEIKKHPLKGAYILSAISMFKDVVPLVKYHHERLDGKGYPEGLKGDNIPFLARILTVADAFDAMTSDRKYRSRLHLEEAINQFKLNSGTQFDPIIVEKLLGLLVNFELMQKDIAATFAEC